MLNVKVIPLIPRGFCGGVVHAIKTAIQTRNEYPDKQIGVLGMIVHNSSVVKQLEELNIKTLFFDQNHEEEFFRSLDVDIVILTAHGTRQGIIDRIQQKGIQVVDTTCEYVINTFDLIKQELRDHHEVLYIGKKGHPEAISSVDIDPQKVHLIDSLDDVDALTIKDPSPLIVNQTTISLKTIISLTEAIKKKVPATRFSNEQCNATRMRQEAVLKMTNEVDLLLVIGDIKSNNSKELVSIGQDLGKEAVLVLDLPSLDPTLLHDKKVVAITSGASTPTYITKQVMDYVTQFDERNAATFDKTPFISSTQTRLI